MIFDFCKNNKYKSKWIPKQFYKINNEINTIDLLKLFTLYQENIYNKCLYHKKNHDIEMKYYLEIEKIKMDGLIIYNSKSENIYKLKPLSFLTADFTI